MRTLSTEIWEYLNLTSKLNINFSFIVDWNLTKELNKKYFRYWTAVELEFKTANHYKNFSNN
jgi:hypothetical protein